MQKTEGRKEVQKLFLEDLGPFFKCCENKTCEFCENHPFFCFSLQNFFVYILALFQHPVPSRFLSFLVKNFF